MKKQSRPAALITGAGRRIARAVAVALAQDGFDIALHYNRSAKDAVKTSGLVKKFGVDCCTFQADFLVEREAVSFFCDVVKRFPRLQVLVNSASMFVPSGLGAEDLVLLEEHMRIHVKTPWVLVAEFAKKVKQGVVINFLDTKISRNVSDFGAYLLSKKTLAELTKMQAIRFAPKVRVNAVAPGLILEPEGKTADYLRQKAATVPLRRHGDVENIVQAVRFLIGNEYVTGQIVFVDGGEHLL